jgi:hypothetical protein
MGLRACMSACLHPLPYPVELETLRLGRSAGLVCQPGQRLPCLFGRLIVLEPFTGFPTIRP